MKTENRKAIAIIRANYLGEDTEPEELGVRAYAESNGLDLDDDLIYQLVEPIKPFTESKRETAIRRAIRDGFRHVIFARRSDLAQNLVDDGGWEIFVAQNNVVIHIAKENCIIQRANDSRSKLEGA